MIASTYYFKPEPEAPEAVKKTQVDSSNAATEKGQLNGSAATEIPPATEIGVNSWNAPTTDSSAADTFILENEKIKIFFLAKGGMPVKAVLKEHLTWQKKTLTLFNNNQLYFRFPAYLGINGTHQIQFIPKPVNTNQLDFNAQAADGSTIALKWTLKPNSYQASLESGFNFKENANQIGSSNVNLRWISNAPGKEKNRQNERDNATVYYKSTGTGEVDKLNPLGFDSLAAPEQFSWIAFKQQFFTSAILPQKPLLSGGLIATRSGSVHPNICPYGEILTCKDGGMVVLAVGSDKQFQELCRILGREALGTDLKYATVQHRLQHREELMALLKDAASAFTASELLPQLYAHFVPAGAIRNMKEVCELPATAHLLLRETLANGTETVRAGQVAFRLD